MQQRGDHSRACAAEGMPQGNGAPLGVDALKRDAQLLHAVPRLASKRFVDLVDVNVIDCQTWNERTLGIIINMKRMDKRRLDARVLER